MLDISFEINGKKVNPNNIGDALEKATMNAVAESTKKKVGSIRDPKTGERPKIKVKGRNLDNLSFEVSGSEELVRLVKEKLK